MSGTQRYRFSPSLGRPIAVEELELDLPQSRKQKKGPEFVTMELEWAAVMAKGIGCPSLLVVVVMRYLAWKAHSQTFTFSNNLLNRYGIDRRTKYHVLEKLEAAGRIKVEHPGDGKAPIITLINVSVE